MAVARAISAAVAATTVVVMEEPGEVEKPGHLPPVRWCRPARTVPQSHPSAGRPPSGAIPFALLLGANVVLGSPRGRWAVVRLDRLPIDAPSCLRFAGAEPHAWFRSRIHQQVDLAPLDLLLNSTFRWIRPGRAVTGP